MTSRSPYLWKNPDKFWPERFAEENANADFGGAWAGYRPEAQGSSLYPNEVASDFSFIPFGGGMRKCVGDQFALTEAAVALVLLLRCGAPCGVLLACSWTVRRLGGKSSTGCFNILVDFSFTMSTGC